MADVDPRLAHLLAGLSDMGDQSPMPMQMVDPQLAQTLAGAGGGHDEVLEMVQRAVRQHEKEQWKQAQGYDPNKPLFPQTMERFTAQAVPYAATSAGATFAGANPLAALLAAGAGTLLPTPAYGQDAEIVKKLQRDLKEKGYYQGPIDGKMEGGTAKAKKAFDDAQAGSEQQAIERRKADAAARESEAKAAAAGAEAAKAKTESERITFEKGEADRKATQRAAGEKRLTEMEDNLPWQDRIFRDWGTPVSVGLGVLGGYLFKRGVVNRSDARAQAAAERGDRLMQGAPPAGTSVTAQNLPERSTRVNEFWTEGQHRIPGVSPPVEQPFNMAPGTPRGMNPNPNAPQASQLYQPNTARNFATDVAAPAGFGVESLVSGYMEGQAQKRLDAATTAAQKDPSEINLRTLQKAKEDVAFWGGLETMGRIGALTYLGKGAITQRTNSRPHTGTAEAERNAIDVYLRRYGGGPNAGGPNPGGLVQPPPPPPPRSGHWDRQNRNAGRFSGGFVDD
jgi:hypothetical protein